MKDKNECKLKLNKNINTNDICKVNKQNENQKGKIISITKLDTYFKNNKSINKNLENKNNLKQNQKKYYNAIRRNPFKLQNYKNKKNNLKNKEKISKSSSKLLSVEVSNKPYEYFIKSNSSKESNNNNNINQTNNNIDKVENYLNNILYKNNKNKENKSKKPIILNIDILKYRNKLILENNKSKLNYSLSLNNYLKDLKINKKNNLNEYCYLSYAYSDYPNLELNEEMQDFHLIKQEIYGDKTKNLFCIFDGHSGKQVGLYLQNNFYKEFEKEIKKINLNKNLNENNLNIQKAIINTFNNLDNKILSFNFKGNNNSDVGSTATIIYLYKYLNKRMIVCANIGDSSGYLIKKKEIIKITKEHKCNDKEEVNRIINSGGKVFQGRVFGVLMITRSFGDNEMKTCGVICTPSFYFDSITKDDLFIIIGSDGIWDVINENDLSELASKNLSSKDFSKKIINLVKERGTRDNSSCIVIKLNKSN